ncbi:hypothetical protein Barb7_03014 [Bacteroidales bacterium Barb7]|nr:hypothetical protein Barb7_03014 [Bacteroidales bacterium Barb7]
MWSSVCLNQVVTGVYFPMIFPNGNYCYCFNKWKFDGTIEEIHEILWDKIHKNTDRERFPGLG